MAKTFLKVHLNYKHWERANLRVKNTKIYENSYRKIEANEVSFLGEVVFEDFLNKNSVLFKDDRISTKHDYTINNSITLDVKTKDRTVLPKKHYDNSVPLYNHDHQRPDFYYFISLLRDKNSNLQNISRFTHAFILGGIDLHTLEEKGKHWKKNQIDPSNNTKFWTDCINVSMDLLIDNRDMIKVFKN